MDNSLQAAFEIDSSSIYIISRKIKLKGLIRFCSLTARRPFPSAIRHASCDLLTHLSGMSA